MAEDFSLDSGSIEETMLGPLWARATYSKLYPEILNDQQAIQIIEKLNYDFTNISNYLEEWRSLGLLVRAKIFDKAIIKYIESCPYSTVVNLGCGLDTTFSRVDNGAIKWFNLDLPDAIKYRNQFITESSRSKNISKSAFDYSWMDDIEFNPENGIIFFAGGFVYYFEEEEIRKLITYMAKKFPGGEFIFEGISKLAIKVINRRARKAGADIRVHYGIGHPNNEFSKWSKNIELIDWYTIWARTPINPIWSKNTLKMIKVSKRLKTAKIVHLKFLG
ncbi:MAG: class I SAM-dependent methyltransferase [Candidatus Lokiarchaeota archaeon]|nr:class I SAM-dependent methyltransferase [Candidatus Lokiarchaeota archaeon]